jgi:hypothetical protein
VKGIRAGTMASLQPGLPINIKLCLHESAASHLFPRIDSNMRPLFFKSTWGFERSAFPDLFPKVAALGYGECTSLSLAVRTS